MHTRSKEKLRKEADEVKKQRAAAAKQKRRKEKASSGNAKIILRGKAKAASLARQKWVKRWGERGSFQATGQMFDI
eukprot:3253210-Rhodomonas_salina.1